MRQLSAALAIALTLCACKRVYVGPNGGDPLGDGSRRLPTQTPRLQRADENDIKRVCRGQRIPGWVAVDYVDDKQSCPNPKHASGNGTALLINHTKIAVGRSLQVCSDQPAPQNWDIIQMVPGDLSCPREPESTSTKPTVMEIRRLR